MDKSKVDTEVEVTEEKKMPEMIIVGYGKHDLPKLLKNVETAEDLNEILNVVFTKCWPARWRRISICDEEEIETFTKFVHLMQEIMEKTDPSIRRI